MRPCDAPPAGCGPADQAPLRSTWTRPSAAWLHPRQHADELILPLAVEAGDADDLAVPQVELDAGHSARRRGSRAFSARSLVSSAEVGMCRTGRPALFAGHQAEQVLFGDLGLLQHADVAAVAHHGGAVGDADQFGDAVGDDEDGGAAVAQLRILTNSRSVESKSSAAEVSSRISTLGSHSSARPMVIHCLMLERQRADQGMSGSMSALRSALRIMLAARSHLAVLRTASWVNSPSTPMKRLSTHRAFVGDQHFLEDCGNARERGSRRRRGRLAQHGDRARCRSAARRTSPWPACSCRSRCRRRWRGSRPARAEKDAAVQRARHPEILASRRGP